MSVFGKSRRQLTVRAHRPVVQWLVYGLAIAAAGVAIWQAYQLGVKKGGFSLQLADTEYRTATEQIEYLLGRNNELVERNAVLRQNAEVERIAHDEIRKSLLEAQQEVAELRQELVFYRNLMSPGDNKPGLHIEAVSLVPELVANAYRFELVLTQVRGKNRLASGQLLVKIAGLQEGEPKVLNLGDVTPDQETGKRFRFKYFQSINGLIELPADFEPKTLEFEAVSSVKGLESVSRSFDWQELNPGGSDSNVGQD